MAACAVISFIMTFMSIPVNSPEMFVIFLILTIASTITAIVRRIRYKSEMPRYVEQPMTPLDPPWEPLSGTFECRSCGAPTTFDREINPPTACSYCGAELPEVKEMILSRNRRRQQRIDDDLVQQKKDRRERLNIHLTKKNEYIAIRKHARAEQTKATAKAMLALGVAVAIIILVVIILPIWMIFHW